MILIIKHIAIEGPGILGDILKNRGFELKEIDLEKGDKFPDQLNNVEGVVVLGGPMNVYEEEKYPFLSAEDIFIKKIVERGIPYLGLCLGAQLLAKAAGASIVKAEEKEIGFYGVELTDHGTCDPLFSGLGKELEVFQWHEDKFEIPQGGRLLATAGVCPNQAFKVGSNAYGLQFHLEVDGDIIKEWIEEYFSSSDDVLMQKAETIENRYEKIKDPFRNNGTHMCENFADIVAKTPYERA